MVQDMCKIGGPSQVETARLHKVSEATVWVSTIRRRLVTAGLVEPNPKKKPKRNYIRFQADLPNETWHSDFTHVWLADGSDTETITWLDDHSRYALHISCHDRVTGNIVLATSNKAVETHGLSASVLTDKRHSTRQSATNHASKPSKTRPPEGSGPADVLRHHIRVGGDLNSAPRHGIWRR